MRLAERVETSDRRKRLLIRVLQFALGVMAVGGVATGRLGITANAVPALIATFVPTVLRREYAYVMDARLVLWITVAVFLHALGAVGLYRWYPWYDEITHLVSGALVAGVGYATLRAFEEHSAEVTVTEAFRGLFVVVFVLAFGVVWEVFEFVAVVGGRAVGTGTPVRVFGIDDIVTDMLANAAGGVLIALWGSRYFGGLADFIRTRLASTEE